MIDWGVAGRAAPGERLSGDRHVVVATQDSALVAVIDGLGHGPEAAVAARRAGDVVQEYPYESPGSLVGRCHKALKGTRGAAMTVARLDGASGMLTWLGVGNVDGRLIRARPDGGRAREATPLRNGVVGFLLPRVRSHEVEVATNDTIILATDGVRSGFDDEIAGMAPPQDLANAIIARHAHGSDDALVLVARVVRLGAPA